MPHARGVNQAHPPTVQRYSMLPTHVGERELHTGVSGHPHARGVKRFPRFSGASRNASHARGGEPC